MLRWILAIAVMLMTTASATATTSTRTPFATLRFVGGGNITASNCSSITSIAKDLIAKGKVNVNAMNLTFACNGMTIDMYSSNPIGTLSSITSIYMGMDTIVKTTNMCGGVIDMTTRYVSSLFGCKVTEQLRYARLRNINMYTTQELKSLCCPKHRRGLVM